MSSPDLHPSDLQADLVPALCDSLSHDGYAIVDGLIGHDLLGALAADCDAAFAAGRFHPAGTGRATGHRVDAVRRGDAILWLEAGETNAPQARFLAAMDALRAEINRRLLLGLHELEAHYAVYPPGAGYMRHRDRFSDDDARIVSLVVYLNPDWVAADGGELRLHLDDAPRDVLPIAGSVALFLSAEIEHEVRPALRARRSIAGWFRRRPIGTVD
jgi:SM-20-related protein